MQKENLKRLILALLVIIFIVLVSPWTFNLLINRIDPWIGPLPWSLFITYGLLFFSCLLLAIYEKLEDV